MIEVTDMKELKGKWLVEERVQILEEPHFVEDLQKWVALANVDGALCFISLKITQLQ